MGIVDNKATHCSVGVVFLIGFVIIFICKQKRRKDILQGAALRTCKLIRLCNDECLTRQ